MIDDAQVLTESMHYQGAIIGYHCTHAYPHTTKEMITTIPATLKGVDKVVYACFAVTKARVHRRHMPDIESNWDGMEGDLIADDLIPWKCTDVGFNDDEAPCEIFSEWSN